MLERRRKKTSIGDSLFSPWTPPHHQEKLSETVLTPL